MVKINGAKEFQRKLDLARTRVRDGKTGEVMFAAAEAIAVEAHISITTGSQSGKKHTPSAPGQPPNNDTGVLSGNLEAVQTGPLSAEASSNAPYSVALEYGTSKMGERPFMRPAVARTVDDRHELFAGLAAYLAGRADGA